MQCVCVSFISITPTGDSLHVTNTRTYYVRTRTSERTMCSANKSECISVEKLCIASLFPFISFCFVSLMMTGEE